MSNTSQSSQAKPRKNKGGRPKGAVTKNIEKERIKLYEPHPAQWKIHKSKKRFRIVACGRRFGKSLMAANETTKFAYENPRETTWWVAPVYSQAAIGFKMIKNSFPDLIKNANSASLKIILHNNAKIEFRSAERPDNLRGEGLGWVTIDEAAFMSEEAWYEALRPALSDRKGQLLAIGTPKGKNWFYHLWINGQDREQEDFDSWQMSTYQNPYIDPAEIDALKRSLPERVFRQEILAEFLDDTGGVFRYVDENIRPYSLPTTAEGLVTLGVDLAKYEDFTVLIGIDGSGKVVYFDRFNQIDWALQKRRIIEAARSMAAKVVIDSTGIGDPIFEDLSREIWVEGIKFTSSSKTNIINNLAMRIEQHDITYPNIPELIYELKLYQYDLTPTGKLKMNAPAGKHDDCVIALALAAWGNSSEGEPSVRLL